MDDRIDFCIEIAGGLIWVAPTDLGGITPAELGNGTWMGEGDSFEDLVRREVHIPLTLYQDDGYNVRLLRGDLTQEEQAQWTARARGNLDVSCGSLFVCGVLTPDFESEFAQIGPAENGGSYTFGASVDVPPGRYGIEVFAYPPGDLSSGWGLITTDNFGKHPGIEPEDAEAYFRRTHPGEEPPGWINYKDEDINYINFIVRACDPFDEVETLGDDGGLPWEFRKPEVCPTGLPSESLSS